MWNIALHRSPQIAGRRRANRYALCAFLMVAIAGTLNPKAAEARAGYARWLKHGTVYRVEGNFGPYKQSFTVRVAWKGNGFVINTPLGTHRLKRRGNSVAFKVYFDKAWANVTWKRSSAFVLYKGQKGTARVRKIDRKTTLDAPPKRKQNFNLR